jgi:molybdopterin-guanine dinucleotide biosynthesis protein
LSLTQPLIVGIGGFKSNSGKTTILCELLRLVDGWEAIKTTRGHYRSCGKDPQSCCVSHLLSTEPIVHSDRDNTFVEGKDTHRYWQAGARNVHWVIGTDEQIGAGVTEALTRVKAPGVFIEGNSFTSSVKPDAMVMAVPIERTTIKKSALDLLSGSCFGSCLIVLTNESLTPISDYERDSKIEWLNARLGASVASAATVFCWQDLPRLAARISQLVPAFAA